MPPPTYGAAKVALFLDAGAGIPHGTFASAFDTGFSFNTGLEYMATNHFSAEGIFGFHHFPAGTSGAIRPFVNAGIGGYKFSPGSTYFGGNVGAGLLKELTAHWGVQASYNFHAVNTPGAVTKFSTLQAGIRFVF